MLKWIFLLLLISISSQAQAVEILNFGADWCPACNLLKTELSSPDFKRFLAEKNVGYLKLNIDNKASDSLKDKLRGGRLIPSTVVVEIKNNKIYVIDRIIGFYEKETLMNKDYFNNSTSVVNNYSVNELLGMPVEEKPIVPKGIIDVDKNREIYSYSLTRTSRLINNSNKNGRLRSVILGRISTGEKVFSSGKVYKKKNSNEEFIYIYLKDGRQGFVNSKNVKKMN